MPNTTMETPLRKIDPRARDRCSRRSVPAMWTAAAALCARPAEAAGSDAVAARSVSRLITRCSTYLKNKASTMTNAIRSPW